MNSGFIRALLDRRRKKKQSWIFSLVRAIIFCRIKITYYIDQMLDIIKFPVVPETLMYAKLTKVNTKSSKHKTKSGI
jgi:hypothetical protein